MSVTSHHITVPGTPIVQEVADGVFAYIQPDGTWWINNTGFVVGRTQVAAVDACATKARTQALTEAIGARTAAPVRILVNTHHHGDHTHGNALFADAAIVAHYRCREEMLAEGKPGNSALIRTGTWTDVDWGDLELAVPCLTFESAIDLWMDDTRCEVRHVGGPAHTTNDSIVWLPAQRVLFSGDLLFNGGTPFLLGGSVTGAVTVLKNLKSLCAETIVPGHGPVAGPELIDQVLAYLDFVLGVTRRGVEAGVAPLEAATATSLGRFGELTDPERLVGNLHRAYADMNGQPVDATAALRDMRTFNGGKPLTCLA